MKSFLFLIVDVDLKFSTAKEIRLRHGAPVVGLTVIDRLHCPLPAPLEVQHERAKAPDMTGGHHLVVCSREQIKVRDFYDTDVLCSPLLFVVVVSTK